MATKREILFQEAVHRIDGLRKLGLPTIDLRNDTYYQGDHTTYSYSHLDIDIMEHLSWQEFIRDNLCISIVEHPNQYRKYDKALSWKEIEEIKDITK